MDVLFPFGHGLSYTNFEYSNITISDDNIKDTDTVTVTVDITNTGDVFGKEVVQLYVSPKNNKIIRPVKELKGFEKIALEPGETKTVSFILNKRSFAYWNMDIHDWHVESGKYDILIGKSVSDIVLSREISVTSTVRIPKTYTLDSIFGDLMEDEKAMAVLAPLLGQFGNSLNVNDEEGGAINSQMLESMIKNMPIRALLGFVPNIELEYIYNILDKINN
ncbi:MAG: fibronectin type III-like domain-contianing protein [Romboutsia timonensis]|uniref:fibronectin type III-like domain-contianing protein n=1 Tax=Romboutsia timonensis TaxID=1776391 RepID=UPI002A750B3B|nr:fibronectin type III-like domain-contianing protein [Romboutsia timonensis]MDY2883596.1 fibronectin type III-like domain-contianing protein [Romboutsia timonensis]